MILRGMITLFCMSVCATAKAMVGGAPAGPDIARHAVMISSDRGSFCSATVLAQDLLLTAGHCVRPGANYKLLIFDGQRTPHLLALGQIVLHPAFDAKAYDKRKFVIDLALVKLAAPLPEGYAPLRLPAKPEEGMMGARYRIAGFGLSVRNDGKTGGTLREATLVGVPLQSDVQLRLEDEGKRDIGACQGDSGGPALRVSDAAGRAVAPILVGVIGSARAREARGCGGFTGVALIGPALPWIRGTAARLGSAVP